MNRRCVGRAITCATNKESSSAKARKFWIECCFTKVGLGDCFCMFDTFENCQDDQTNIPHRVGYRPALLYFTKHFKTPISVFGDFSNAVAEPQNTRFRRQSSQLMFKVFALRPPSNQHARNNVNGNKLANSTRNPETNSQQLSNDPAKGFASPRYCKQMIRGFQPDADPNFLQPKDSW